MEVKTNNKISDNKLQEQIKKIDDDSKANMDLQAFREQLDSLLNTYIEKINIFKIYQELCTQKLWAEFNCNKILEIKFQRSNK